MSRSTDYQRKPSESWTTLKTELEETTFYLVQRFGPTVFSIRNEEGQVYKVTIGDPHKCSCPVRPGQHCLHIMFCLLKVLRIPVENHMSWQTGFTDTEVEIVLAKNFGNRSRRPVARRVKPATPPPAAEGTAAGQGDSVPRQPLDGDECFCPICQDQMTLTQALSWCRKGCGNNIHAKCMKMYAQYKLDSHAEVGCPLCREEWVSMAELNEDCRSANAVKTRCAHVSCSSCSMEIRGDFYRCIECSLSTANRPDVVTVRGKILKTTIDFCKNCFDRIGRAHSTHHFINSDVNSVYQEFTWQSAINPRGPSTSAKFPPELLLSLQGRDLTAADYELLMALDEKKCRAPPLHEMLVESLSEPPPDASPSFGLPRNQLQLCRCCKQPLPPQSVINVPSDPVSLATANLNGVSCEETALKDGSVIRLLPCCQAHCHTACVDNEIRLAMRKEKPVVESSSTDTTYSEISVGAGCLLDSIKCFDETCGKAIFGRLSRKRRKKGSIAATAEVVGDIAVADSSVNQNFGFGISGTSMLQMVPSGDNLNAAVVADISTNATGPDRQISVRSALGRNVVTNGTRERQRDPSPSLLALNAMHMSMDGQESRLSSRQGGHGSRRIAKGLTLSSKNKTTDRAQEILQDTTVSANTVQATELPPAGRAMARQVGGRTSKAKPTVRPQLNRHGSFQHNHSTNEFSADMISVRSASADASDRTGHVGDLSATALVGSGIENLQNHAATIGINISDAGSSIISSKRYNTARVIRGSLIRSRRAKPEVVEPQSDSEGGVQLCLNVNHYS